ncbi:MAG: DUF354 domain-containing protein [Thermoplasmata archaeon]|nr:DUF354 domain-containing protein [Thermoplasmata archaeon]
MRVLFDIAHPANVHFFKHVMWELRRMGHETAITIREREGMIRPLLDAYGFEYMEMLPNQRGLLRKASGVPINDIMALRCIHEFEPDLIIGRAAPYIAHARALTRTPYVIYEDTEVATMNLMLSLPFTTRIIVHTGYQLRFGRLLERKVDRIPAYKELACLHPNWFTPDPNIRAEMGLGRDEKIVLVRLSARDSSHDFGVSGLPHAKRALMPIVKRLEEHARVLITSELEMPEGMEEYAMDIEPHRIHDLMAELSLYVGEGSTMAAEAACLGVPWIFVSNQTRGQLEEMERDYGLGFKIGDRRAAIDKAVELLGREDLLAEWQSRRARLLEDKIDFVRYLVDLAVGYDAP